MVSQWSQQYWWLFHKCCGFIPAVTSARMKCNRELVHFGCSKLWINNFQYSAPATQPNVTMKSCVDLFQRSIVCLKWRPWIFFATYYNIPTYLNIGIGYLLCLLDRSYWYHIYLCMYLKTYLSNVYQLFGYHNTSSA